MNMEAISVLPMSVDQWILVPDNPRQRDTESHAKSAVKKHLSELSPVHRVVHAATIDGETPACKLDGHTRAWLWKVDKLERPKSNTMMVMLYKVNDLREAGELYTHFDNSQAAETSSDKFFGGCREQNIRLESALLNRLQISNALKFATSKWGGHNFSHYELISIWKNELLELDSWNISKGKLSNALISVALLCIHDKRYETSIVREFFHNFVTDAGVKEGKLRDGVQALSELVERKKNQSSPNGWKNITDLAERALTCVNMYVQGKRIRSVRRTSIEPLRVAKMESINNE